MKTATAFTVTITSKYTFAKKATADNLENDGYGVVDKDSAEEAAVECLRDDVDCGRLQDYTDIFSLDIEEVQLPLTHPTFAGVDEQNLEVVEKS